MPFRIAPCTSGDGFLNLSLSQAARRSAGGGIFFPIDPTFCLLLYVAFSSIAIFSAFLVPFFFAFVFAPPTSVSFVSSLVFRAFFDFFSFSVTSMFLI